MNYSAQAASVSSAAAVSTAKSAAKSSISQSDFREFLRSRIGRLEDISMALADDSLPLNLPEYGMLNITGQDKMKPGTLFALGNLTSELQNSFSLVMDLYMDSLELLYDQPTKLLMGT